MSPNFHHVFCLICSLLLFPYFCYLANPRSEIRYAIPVFLFALSNTIVILNKESDASVTSHVVLVAFPSFLSDYCCVLLACYVCLFCLFYELLQVTFIKPYYLALQVTVGIPYLVDTK